MRKHFKWQDTDELLSDYRQRMKQFTPPIVKQWYKVDISYTGDSFGRYYHNCCGFIVPTPPREQGNNRLIFGLILVVPVIGFASYLTNLIGGIMLRNIKSVDYCKISITL